MAAKIPSRPMSAEPSAAMIIKAMSRTIVRAAACNGRLYAFKAAPDTKITPKAAALNGTIRR